MTTDELFPAAEITMDSPRLAWMKRHGIITWYDDGRRDGFQVCPSQWFAGLQQWWPGKTGIHFFAEETAHNGGSRIGEGDTEDDALEALARNACIPPWNEEAK